MPSVLEVAAATSAEVAEGVRLIVGTAVAVSGWVGASVSVGAAVGPGVTVFGISALADEKQPVSVSSKPIRMRVALTLRKCNLG